MGKWLITTQGNVIIGTPAMCRHGPRLARQIAARKTTRNLPSGLDQTMRAASAVITISGGPRYAPCSIILPLNICDRVTHPPLLSQNEEVGITKLRRSVEKTEGGHSESPGVPS